MSLIGKVVSQILAVVVPVFAIVGGGYLFGRLRKESDLRLVTDYITYIAAPALIFNSLVDRTLPYENFYLILGSSLFIALGGLLISYAISKKFVDGSPAATLTMAFMNCGNMGLPVCYFAFGKPGLSTATIFFVAMSLLHYSAGTAIASGRGKIRDAFILPLTPAAVLGILVNRLDIAIPPIIARPVGLLSDSAIPLMLFSLGIRLALITEVHGTLPWKLGMGRFIIGLGMGLASASLFSLAGVPAWAIIVQASMPPAVFNFILCEKFGKDSELAASTILAGTVLSLVTLPLLLFVAFLTLGGS
ncbi:MAG: AEC family transporter [Deltaproteobacteria bacterium]|nr:MAG: AEC family transporter [Deltaproteobacteria bacterium]